MYLPCTDWVNDKLSTHFAFEGMCWERSKIPKLIWQMGDSTSNIIESLHADVNTEGIACSLVTGVHRGHHFDNLKLKTLDVRFQILLCMLTADIPLGV